MYYEVYKDIRRWTFFVGYLRVDDDLTLGQAVNIMQDISCIPTISILRFELQEPEVDATTGALVRVRDFDVIRCKSEVFNEPFKKIFPRYGKIYVN